MADLASLHAPIERMARDQKARDEGLRSAFRLLSDALLRRQAVVDDVHAAAAKKPPPSGIPALLAEIKNLLEQQPGQVVAAVREALRAGSPSH